MAFDEWITFNDVELVNVSRTAQLAEVMGLSSVWTLPPEVQWIEDALGGVDYDDVTTAPWYDPGLPASAEFAGLVPLSIPAMDDSSLTSTPVEYINDGGTPGRPRSAMLAMVVSATLVGSTDRGVEYGKRWLDKVLRGSGPYQFCTGSDFTYFRAQYDTNKAHRRDVRTTRGATVTRKRRTDCDTQWWVSFTLTCGDPFEYGESIPTITTLGPAGTTGPKVLTSGDLVLTKESCPQYDYTPIYDPLYPSLVPSPTVPNFFPSGWTDVAQGTSYDRFWAVTEPIEPSTLDVVPIITLNAVNDARMVKVSIWAGDAGIDANCDPLFSVVVTYLPGGQDFIIDGEVKASYIWDGFSEAVRRADSLVFNPDANPVQWASFNSIHGLLVTLDLYGESDFTLAGDGQVEASVALVRKSD